MHPSSGVLKLWEKDPETVEHLFRNVLFGDTGGNVSAAQNCMDSFLEAYESLRGSIIPETGHTSRTGTRRLFTSP